MASFSERYGYTKPTDVIIREKITPEIQNAICNCYDRLENNLKNLCKHEKVYQKMEEQLWLYFLNQRDAGFDWDYKIVATEYLEKIETKWYEKINLVEYSIKFLSSYADYNYHKNINIYNSVCFFIQDLNSEFKRLNFSYRIVNKEIAEITTEQEIIAIEEALKDSKDNVRKHLNDALKLYALKPIGNYRNSIKDSISAVEAFCRERTREDTLGKALKKLESSGVIMPEILKTAFHKLYAYTNDPVTGIRHALMDDEGSYVPQAEEALFMLVSCSAFINYLNKKVK